MDDDRGHGILLAAVFFLVVSWITVSLRVYVRTVMLKSFGADDWTMILTQVCRACIGSNAVLIMQDRS